MPETWISRPELESVLGHDAAHILCRAYGGVPFYVPRNSNVPHSTPPLLRQLLGPHAFAALCREYGGLRITIPNGRKADPFKVAIARKLGKGCPAASIALELGVTERYVRMVAKECAHKTRGPRQLRLF